MNQNSNGSYKALLASPLDHPEKLDQLWSAYMETKNTDFVLKIVSVLDWDDRIRQHLEAWLKQAVSPENSEYSQRLADWTFPIDYGSRTIGGPVDLDLHVALLAKSGHLKFDQLPVQIPMQDLIRLSMKSAALWSLLSVAEQDSDVSDICVRESQRQGGASRSLLAQ